MEGHNPHIHLPQHHHHQQHHHHHLNIPVNVTVDQTDRFPQWSIQETKEFLMIRAELDQTFMETKRNKLLWEVTSSKMKDKGFNRSPEQCKCKWKNLVTRYKGCETMEPEVLRQQFPFYSELQAIFTARMQRMLWAEAESGASGSKKKTLMTTLSSDEDEENNEDYSEGDTKVSSRKKKKIKATKLNIGGGGVGNNNDNIISNMKEILEEFMNQQMQMELQWREAFEAREKERQMKEMEWRRNMEALEHERIVLERRWRERDEQRRIRDEARAEKRDALITTLLNKLTRDDHIM